ncbi:MAG: 50S ribosomal protein L24 [Clostridia bacterium]|jgi:large subunit ribosomal protein L24|nr:50S ribosomal protein L24 [Clostridia bacterium]MDH7571940.1 50S ribosomal protein L24 [Clostridia bacterium]
MHVKKGDTVVVITGKEKGKRGKVLAVDRRRNRVTVEGVNLVKRHLRPTRQLPQGGIVEKEASVHASNVLLWCARCEAPSRVGRSLLEDGKKVRVCRRCGEHLD